VPKTDTKTKILDAAERLFREQGIGAVSVRAIIGKAGVNIAAIHYHFGSKEVVVKNVVIRLLEPVNSRRLELLDQLEEEYGIEPIPLEKVLEAFLEPLVKMAAEDPARYLSFKELIGRIHAEPNEIRTFMHLFQDVFNRFFMAIKKVLPELNEQQLLLGFSFTMGALGSMIYKDQLIREHISRESKSMDYKILKNYVIRFIAGGFHSFGPQAHTKEI